MMLPGNLRAGTSFDTILCFPNGLASHLWSHQESPTDVTAAAGDVTRHDGAMVRPRGLVQCPSNCVLLGGLEHFLFFHILGFIDYVTFTSNL